jgi:hypothetical protein
VKETLLRGTSSLREKCLEGKQLMKGNDFEKDNSSKRIMLANNVEKDNNS